MLRSVDRYPFRLGTTSYILPADILPNVHYLAGLAAAIELVLFEVDDGLTNLPSAEATAELQALASAHHLSYTVHLPLDLRLGDADDEHHISLLKARKVIECTRGLDPWAFVLHLDGRGVRKGADARQLAQWQTRACRALEIVGGWAGGVEKLAVENLEGYPLDFIDPIIERVPASRCVDVGHLWLDGHDPRPHLEAALPRTRVTHMHGIAARDHQSLAHVPVEQLHSIVELLLQANYRGVVTLEVFSEADLHSSLIAFDQAWTAVTGQRTWKNG